MRQKEILGFSHFRILKNRYIFLGIELIISGVLTVINYYFACLFAIILIDYIFCELLYKVYISNALYEIEKGGINMSLITLKNVKKEYGKNQVLFENLSLEIEKGEFVGLVGKSGAGKTTLLNNNRIDYRYI